MKAGAVNYLNALPLIHNLPWEIFGAPPVEIQRRFLRGEFDIALCSVTTALCNEEIRIVPATAIGCKGPVASVILILREGINDVHECENIALDSESNTSNLLLKVLLQKYFQMDRGVILSEAKNLEARQDPSALIRFGPQDDMPVDAHLIIGDRALLLAGDWRLATGDCNVIDLGEVWHEWTGLPFVFAAWLTRSATISRNIVKTLMQTRDDNLHNIHELADGDKLKGTSKNLFRSEILNPSSETRKMSKKPGGVAGSYVDGFFVKSDEVAAEGAKLQPKEVFRGALKYLAKNICYEFGPNEMKGLSLFHEYLTDMGLTPSRPLPIAKIVDR